jgi:uncharacterized protein (TIGR00266 family)
MDIEIIKGPGSSAAKVTLQPGESCVAEGGSMIAMRGNFDISTQTQAKKRSITAGLKRLVGGESFFQNYYTLTDSTQGEIIFAPSLPGDMLVINPSSVGIIAEGGSFVIRSSAVTLDTTWQGVKSLFSGEGLFWLRLHGQGEVVLNTFGASYSIDVDGEYLVDTGHIVAFEETLDFSIAKAGTSWISSFLGGEGLVCRLTGKGRVWCQSHNPPAFGRLLSPMLRPR